MTNGSTRSLVRVGVLLLLVAVVLGTVRFAATSSNSPPANSAPSPASSPSPQPSITPGTTPSSSSASSPADAPSASVPPAGPPEKTQLPRGGTTLFPRYRLVGFSGGPGTAAFGRLGVGDIDTRIHEIERMGTSYDSNGKRQIMPVLELITVVAHSTAGPDGKYRGRIDAAVIDSYLSAARRHRALLLLNVQPGRAGFLDEVKDLQPWLKEPDVGLALDPEWAVGAGQVPGRVFGHTTAGELNQVGAWLGAFTRSRGLPEKAMVVHQLSPRIISDIGEVKAHKGVQVVLSVDGIGGRKAKESTWRRLVEPMPDSMAPGFKLFFEEDTRAGKLMTPAQVLNLKPRPDYVLYE
jgi:hypothetical protein